MLKNSCNEVKYCFGYVNWYGGYNNKTGKKNDFGFIDSNDKSFFVHSSTIQNCMSLHPTQRVLFTYKNGEKGLTATEVFELSSFNVDVDDIKKKTIPPLLNFLAIGDNFKQAISTLALRNIIRSLLESNEGKNVVNKLINLCSPRDVAIFLKECKNWNLLFENSDFSFWDVKRSLTTIGLSLLPSSFIDKNITHIVDYFHTLAEDEKNNAIDIAFKNFSFSSILCLIFNGCLSAPKYYKNTDELQIKFESFIAGTVTRINQIEVNDIVRITYKKCFISFEQYCSHQAIAPIITPMLVKRKIFIKDMSFVQDIKNNPELLNDPEFWFLSIILPLVYANNAHEDIEKVALTRFWEALLSKQFDVGHPSIFKLFPQCLSLKCNYPDMDLSCEAFHWEKDGESIFLCRSKKCSEPRVLPDLSKSYLDFSLFDWLAHYGINYANEQEPSKRDFSIKLAGYVNRIHTLDFKQQAH